jgi:hypothetical protein
MVIVRKVVNESVDFRFMMTVFSLESEEDVSTLPVPVEPVYVGV